MAVDHVQELPGRELKPRPQRALQRTTEAERQIDGVDVSNEGLEDNE